MITLLNPVEYAYLVTTALEFGIGYWCNDYKPFGTAVGYKINNDPYYLNPDFWVDGNGLVLTEFDEADGSVIDTHELTLEKMQNAFDIAPNWVKAQLLNDGDDSVTSDIIIQLAIFGEIVYG